MDSSLHMSACLCEQGLEEVSRTEIGKKIKEGMEEAAKTAKTSAESVSKSGEMLGKTGAFKAISQVHGHFWVFMWTFAPSSTPNQTVKKSKHIFSQNKCTNEDKWEFKNLEGVSVNVLSDLCVGNGECEERDRRSWPHRPLSASTQATEEERIFLQRGWGWRQSLRSQRVRECSLLCSTWTKTVSGWIKRSTC